MTIDEIEEDAQLDQAWMHAEAFADVFIAISAGRIPLDTLDARDLILKACAMVGLECKRKQRVRAEEEATP